MSKTENVPPCPFCADPKKMFAPPKGRGTDEVWTVVHMAGRFWAQHPSVLRAVKFGHRWIAEVAPKFLADRFKGFSVRLIGLHVGFKELGPPPFSDHVLHHTKRPPSVRPPVSRAAPTVALTQFSACVIEGAGVRLEGHWWPSHGWRITQSFELNTRDPEDRTGELEAAHIALDFFLLETRGAPRITERAVREAIKEIGPRAQQKVVAARLGVTAQGLTNWRERQGINSWREIVSKYID